MSAPKASIIRRMYGGFAIIIALFITTVSLLLTATDSVHQQLNEIDSKTLPLINATNQTSVNLLLADKAFKDVLTTEQTELQQAYRATFADAKQAFVSSLEGLNKITTNSEQMASQMAVLQQLKENYFSASESAMENHQQLLAATEKRQLANRRFQKLQTELRLGLTEHIASKQDRVLSLMAKNYFGKLKQTEVITSDALASDDINAIQKAMNDNKRSVTQLNFTYQGLASQIADLKEQFDEPTQQFIQDVGKKGGVLDQHHRYLMSQQRLDQDIVALTKQVNQALAVLANFRAMAAEAKAQTLANAQQSYLSGQKRAAIIGLVVFLFLLLLSWHLSQSVRSPLNTMLSALEIMVQGRHETAG